MPGSSPDAEDPAIENVTDVTLDSSTGAVSDVASAPSTDKPQGVVSLDVMVNAALDQKQEASPASEQDPKGSDSDNPNPSEDEISEEEMKNYSAGVRHRLRELAAQRKTAVEESKQFRQELEAVKPKAERMDQLLGYMEANKVSPEHLDNALGLTALINGGQYEKALPVLEALVAQVRAAAGDVLPPDLQQQVNLGYITEAHAKELHKAKLTVQRTTQQSQQDRERAEQQRYQRESQALIQTTASAADAWSAEQATSDPDWNLKRDLVTERVENLIGKRTREQGPAGYPRTAQEVRELLDAAKKDVEQTIKRFRPAVKPIDPPVNGNNASPRSKAAPASLMDAVNAVLR